MPITVNSSLPFDLSTLLILAVAGMVLKVFFSGNTTPDGSSGPASSAIWGYGLTAMSLVGILVVITSLSTREAMNMGIFDAIKTMVTSSLPLVATLVVIGWLIIINMTYRKQINSGRVATEYNQFSFFSTILLILQMAVMFKYLLEKIGINMFGNNQNSTMSRMADIMASELTSITVILTLLNLIFVGMMQIVVEFFSTDG